MHPNPPTRRFPHALLTTAACVLSFAACAAAQNLPPSAPTRPATPAPASIQSSAASTATTQPAYRARVEYIDGKLSVTAANSSLNQILRDIASLTGLKITGGVREERVFGAYGPALAQDVIGQLLDGTGTNVLLRSNGQHAVQELVLTPRSGGVTPPNPNAARESAQDEADLPPQLGGRRRAGRNVDNDRQPEPENTPNPPNQPLLSPNPPASTPTDSAQSDTTQQSPNGVKTPQQIYEELSQRMKQQPQTPAPPQ